MNSLQTPTELKLNKSQLALNHTEINTNYNSNLKAIFLPVFNKINPYQEQLIKNLVDLGMQIEAGNVSNYLIPTIININYRTLYYQINRHQNSVDCS